MKAKGINQHKAIAMGLKASGAEGKPSSSFAKGGSKVTKSSGSKGGKS